MSLTTLCAMAVQRDLAPPLRTKRSPSTAEDATKTEEQGYLNTLVSAIPTEPLALYTFLTAGIVGTIDAGESQRVILRWAIYGLMIVFIVVWLGVVYLRNRSAGASSRRFPVAETATALIAFSTWGLVTPESPLNAKLDGDDQVVWTLIITTVGAGLLALMGLWLNDKVRR